MINSDTRIDEALLLRYFEGEVTRSEKEEIEKWIISSEANKKLAKQIYYLSFATKTMDTLKRTDARAALKGVRGRIRRERQLQWGRWAQRAAAILAIPLLLSTLYLWMNSNGQSKANFIEIRTNPGMITSTTLPDGTYVTLNYEAERIGRLVDKQILSKIRLDQANKEKEVAQMKVEQAKAQMQRSQMDYSYTTITAPFDGYIDRIPYKTGSLVNPQSLLTTVSDISEIFAYYKVNESEYLEYKRQQLSGQKQHEENNVELILPDGSIYSHKGTLETVEGDFERGTGSIAFRVRFPNPDGLLKHGVTGKVRMMTQMDNICLVPQKSTFEIQDFTYVYTVDSTSVVKVRSFQPLERYNNYYVTQDFTPNTAIVYEGVQMMKDGITIKTDTIDMEAIRKEVELKQPIVK